MEPRQLSLPHVIQLPAASRSEGQPYPAILALHGRGSNEEDLMGLAPHLPEGLLWVSPRAPLLLGPGSYEWYRVRTIGVPDPDQVMTALETIDGFLGEILSAYPIDPQKLFLLGFSQGGMLSMCYTLNRPARVSGVVAHSGYIPMSMDLQIDEGGIKGKPFLLAHGQQDTLIPVEWARASRDRLQELSADVSYHEFQMGHTVSMESLAIIHAWLATQLQRE
jgi:phospholipase/carboxylesterase